jgi:hypothetical protein
MLNESQGYLPRLACLEAQFGYSFIADVFTAFGNVSKALDFVCGPLRVAGKNE